MFAASVRKPVSENFSAACQEHLNCGCPSLLRYGLLAFDQGAQAGGDCGCPSFGIEPDPFSRAWQIAGVPVFDLWLQNSGCPGLSNREDGCTGRFWEGRFKSQLLCDDRAILAAMAYVDLNPIRAGIARRLDQSPHTSIQHRIATTQRNPETLHAPLTPLAGRIASHLPISTADYLALLEWTGRQLHPGKRGSIPKDAPSCLRAMEQEPQRWAVRVKSVGSGYWRVIGGLEDMISIAERLRQRWVKGIGLAARLA